MSRLKTKKVSGIGINDADYVVQKLSIDESGKRVTLFCPFYKKWKAMIDRCYSLNLRKKLPTYSDCSVCDEWLTFSTFKSWMEKQDWEGKELDKDLKAYGNKVYSPDTCLMVDKRVNVLAVERRGSDKGYGLGVSPHNISKNIYSAKISNEDGKLIYLGIFYGKELAHKAWQERKIQMFDSAIKTQKDSEVILCLKRMRDRIQDDIDNGAETIYENKPRG